MTVRTPVYWDGSSVKEMSSSMITTIIQRCVYLYGGTGYTDLRYVTSAGSLNRMIDTRDQASAGTTGVSDFVAPAAATDATASTTNDHIQQDLNAGTQPVDTNNIRYPLYIDGTSGLRAMTLQDMKDTFIYPAILLLVDGNDRDGTFKVVQGNAANPANHVQVSSNPIFGDTRYDISIHGGLSPSDSPVTVSFIPSSGLALDIPDTPVPSDRKWYLWRAVQGNNGNPNGTEPLYANLNGSIQTYLNGGWDNILQGIIHYTAGQNGDVGYRIRYEIRKSGGTGDSGFPANPSMAATWKTKGDTMTDTTLNADVRVQQEINNNDYRSQNLPTGSPETETEYELMIFRV